MSVSELSGLRASNVDRELVVERLHRAHAEGRLDLHELDERLAVAYAARTYGELEPLTADLPPHVPGVGAARAGGAGSGAGAGAGGAGGSGADAGVGAAGAAGVGGSGSRRARGYALALRVEGASWLFASALNLAIWVMVSVFSAESVYPWWIWVAGPWGAVLLARILGEGFRVRSRAGCSTRF